MLTLAIILALPGLMTASEPLLNNRAEIIDPDSVLPDPDPWATVDEDMTPKGFGDIRMQVVPAAAFKSKGNDSESTYFPILSGYIRGTSAAGGCVQAPLYLPQGARIDGMFVTVYDNDASNNITVTLTRTDNYEYFTYTDLNNLSSSGSSTSMQNIGGYTLDEVVTYPRYSYFVHTCLPTLDTRLYAVRVYFFDDQIFSDGFEIGNTLLWSSVVY
jgi:hypothetical protein